MGDASAGWYSRCYQPRFNGEVFPQLVTLHLCDAITAGLLERWQAELQGMEEKEAEAELRRRLERHLDTGQGEAWLSDPEIAGLVEHALLLDDAERYALHAWVIMPNHAHVLLTPFPTDTLAAIVSTWQIDTARDANALLERRGEFWRSDLYDQSIRNEDHYTRAIAYIEQNPVKATLCATPADWPWSSAPPPERGRPRPPISKPLGMLIFRLSLEDE